MIGVKSHRPDRRPTTCLSRCSQVSRTRKRALTTARRPLKRGKDTQLREVETFGARPTEREREHRWDFATRDLTLKDRTY